MLNATLRIFCYASDPKDMMALQLDFTAFYIKYVELGFDTCAVPDSALGMLSHIANVQLY